MYKQKDIVLINFPYTDFTASKVRPALIISNNSIHNPEDIICCLITSNLNASGITINDKDIESGKLHFESLVRPHRVFTISRTIIKKRIATITSQMHTQIIKKLESVTS